MASTLLETGGRLGNGRHDLLIPVELGLAPFLEVVGDWGLRLNNLLLHRGQGLDGLRLEYLFNLCRNLHSLRRLSCCRKSNKRLYKLESKETTVRSVVLHLAAGRGCRDQLIKQFIALR